MVLPINNGSGNPLAQLLTNVNEQARVIAFNVRFNQMQNTVINRINSESEKIADVEGNQRELDDLNKTLKDLGKRRESIVAFAFANESNGDNFNDIVTAASVTRTSFSLGDADTNNISAEEITAFETNRATISTLSNRLVELSHEKFIDGNNVTRLRSQIDSLLALTPVVGPIDAQGTVPATNDNRAIIDGLADILSTAGTGSDASSTLQLTAVSTLRAIDAKLSDANKDIREVNVFRAGEIEFELQMLRSKYANFLRSIELAFETSSQSISALTNALNQDKEPDKGSILSILT